MDVSTAITQAYHTGLDDGRKAGLEAAADTILDYMSDKHGALLYGLRHGLDQVRKLQGAENDKELC